ncbi:MAG: biotin/lipoyl-containing protein [Gemmatimonadales bacterium]
MKYLVTIGERRIEVEITGQDVRVDGTPVAAHLEGIPGTPALRLVLDDVPVELAVEGRTADQWQLVAAGTVHEVEVVDERTAHIRSLAGASGVQAAGGSVKAPMPGLVVRVLVEVGATVEKGQGLVVLEAMKMENELRAPADGIVTALHATTGAAVDKGAVLVELGPPA